MYQGFKNLLNKIVPANWKHILLWMVGFGVVSWSCSFLGCTNTWFPSPPMPIWLEQAFHQVGEGKEAHYNFGWHQDPNAVEAIVKTLKFRTFADTPAGQVQDPLPEQVFLWQIYKKADPRGPPIKNQGQVGSCVSFGTNNAVLRTMVCYITLQQIANGQPPDQIKDIVEEATYGGSRIQIGEQKHGARMRGSDGSVGAFAAEWVRDGGLLPREKTADGKYDLSTYSESLCRQWGNSGVPADLIAACKVHYVQQTTQVQGWADAKKALASGYGIAVCSNQGFTMQRDSNGIARASGHWGHCMCLDGYCAINGAEYGHIQNSWGPNAHTGPVGPGDPDTGGFWAASATVDSMLGAGDSWTFAAVKGFPSQRKELDWVVRNQQRIPNNVLEVYAACTLPRKLAVEFPSIP